MDKKWYTLLAMGWLILTGVCPFLGQCTQTRRRIAAKKVEDGVDYALTEVVHCKSKDEIGVEEALQTCTKLYLQDVVELSGSKVIVVLGRPARKAVEDIFKNELKDAHKLSNGDVFGPLHVGERKRYIVFLPHTNARQSRTFAKCIDEVTLQKLRAVLHGK